VRAEDERRKFFTDLVQYAVWWIVNINRSEPIPIQDFDPQRTMESFRTQAKSEPKSKAEMSKEAKEELRRRMDAEAYKEHYQKQNKK